MGYEKSLRSTTGLALAPGEESEEGWTVFGVQIFGTTSPHFKMNSQGEGLITHSEELVIDILKLKETGVPKSGNSNGNAG